jgi:hypothetical protein
LPLTGFDVPGAVGAPGWQSGPQLVVDEVVDEAVVLDEVVVELAPLVVLDELDAGGLVVDDVEVDGVDDVESVEVAPVELVAAAAPVDPVPAVVLPPPLEPPQPATMNAASAVASTATMRDGKRKRGRAVRVTAGPRALRARA